MTIAGILEREFGEAFYALHREADDGVVSGDDLAAFLVEHHDARAVTSHHLQYPMPLDDTVLLVDCCPVRGPLDRLESLYAFARRSPPQPLHALAYDHDVAGFLEALLDHQPNYVYNWQTVTIGNASRFIAAGEAELERAVARLRASFVPVLVERFDESMVVAEYFLAPIFPGLRLHYAARNVSRDHGPSEAEREAALRARCGARLAAALDAATQLDRRLCAAVGAELDRRIAAVPSFAARLDAFRGRCAETVPATA